MKTLISRIFPIFLIMFFISILLPHRVSAALTDNYVEGGIPDELYKARTQKSLNQGGMGFRQTNVQYTKMIEDILGPIPNITAVAYDPEYNKSLAQKSAVGGVSNLIAMMYDNPPASTYAFVQDLGHSLGFIPKTANAQGTGIGFTGLSPLLDLWKGFRNIAYLLISVVMVAIGFMVMFRKKIDPKAVVTVQNSLPRIVIALLLVTFSYAIVGLVIDLMYIVIVFIGGLIVSQSNNTIDASFSSSMMSGNFLTTMGNMFTTGWNTVPKIMEFIGYPATGAVATGAIVAIIGALAAAPPVAAAGAVVGLAVPFLLYVFVSLAILFAVVRLFFLLVNAYIQIIISLLTAPIQLMLVALPGNNSFESWLKNLIANVAVFPVSFMMIMVAALLNRSETAGSLTLWAPPMLSSSGSQGLSGLIGLGILFVIPTIANGIKESLKAKSPIPAGPGAIMAPVTGTFQTVMGTASQFYYGGAMLGTVKNWIKPKKE